MTDTTDTTTDDGTDSEDEESKTFCAAYLKGKCERGPQCRALHLQWDSMVQAQYCPLHVVGQCPHRCKFGLKHQLGFPYTPDSDFELFKIISDTVKVKTIETVEAVRRRQGQGSPSQPVR